MVARIRDKERTRTRLLDAGLTVADRDGLKATTVNAVIAQADSSKGAFFHHFEDRPAYLIALHRRFHNKLFEDVAGTTRKLTPGRDLLIAGSKAYLDGCLRNHGTRGLLFEARGEPRIRDEIEVRNRQMAEQVAASLELLGVKDAKLVARLWIAAVVEVATLEHSKSRPIPAARRALAALIPAVDPSSEHRGSH